ncbi:histidinol-phosphate transaminase [Desulfopila sp. IMCC35008]|uniref:histidinol-phosphate transaminase n=1 Tax=Desulfopila sp. IMCC35008 TaxID=2653858 RepID=UPI0013D73D2F|nr:histidinol-phosphate transaminase [Desulfopila sp. IMCC35008]
MKLNIPENIKKITPYPPGKPLDELEREFGITDSIKLASNENAWGPSPKAIEAIKASLGDLHRYPDGSGYYLTQAIAARFEVLPEEVVLGNGSNEIIEFLVKAFVREGDEVITSHPSFLMYQKFVQVRAGVNKVIPLQDMHHDLNAIVDAVTDKTRLIFIDNPNNPTGTFISPKELDSFFKRIPESVIVALDEAYVDFMEKELQGDIRELIDDVEGRCPVVLLRTFSKAYGISGLRVGFGLMSAPIAGCLHKVRQPFNINSLAQIGAKAALEDNVYFDMVINETRSGMRSLMEAVERLGCTSYPSQTNFFLIDVKGNANDLYTAMLYKGVIVRSMNAYGFPTCIRITVGTKEENERFVKALADCLKELKYV